MLCVVAANAGPFVPGRLREQIGLAPALHTMQSGVNPRGMQAGHMLPARQPRGEESSGERTDCAGSMRPKVAFTGAPG